MSVFRKLQLVPAAFIAVDRHTVAQYAAEFPVTYYWVPVTDNMYRAAIQRRGSILAWTVILSVHGADTIAIDLSLSALIS